MAARVANDFSAAAGEGETLTYAPPAGSTLIGGTLTAAVGADGHAAPTSKGTIPSTGFVGLYEPQFVDNLGGDRFYECVYWDAPTPCRARTTDNTTSSADTLNTTFHLPADRGGDLYVTARCFSFGTTPCTVNGSDGYIVHADVSVAHLLLGNASSPAGAQFSGS